MFVWYNIISDEVCADYMHFGILFCKLKESTVLLQYLDSRSLKLGVQWMLVVSSSGVNMHFRLKVNHADSVGQMKNGTDKFEIVINRIKLL